MKKITFCPVFLIVKRTWKACASMGLLISHATFLILSTFAVTLQLCSSTFHFHAPRKSHATSSQNSRKIHANSTQNPRKKVTRHARFHVRKREGYKHHADCTVLALHIYCYLLTITSQIIAFITVLFSPSGALFKNLTVLFTFFLHQTV